MNHARAHRFIALITVSAATALAGAGCDAGVDAQESPVAVMRSALSSTPASLATKATSSAAPQGTSGACGPGHLALTGGQPMQGPGNTIKIAPFVWGAASRLNYPLSVIDGFYGNAFVNGSLWYSWIRREYHLANVSPLATKALTLTSANASKTLVRNSDVQAEIMAHLLDGTLPLGAGNTTSDILYVVHFPASIQIEFGDDPANLLCGGANGTTYKGTMACAYNQNPSSFKWQDGATIHYAIMPDITTGPCATNCGFNAGSPTNNETMVESHEVIEAITDPIGGWYDLSNSIGPDGSSTGCGQIGDLCNARPVTTNGAGPVVVQQMWSNAAGACEGNRPGALADFTGAGASGILLVGDTDPGATNPQFHVAETTVSGNGTGTTLTAADLIDSANWGSPEKIGIPVTGDFNGDGFSDVALIGAQSGNFPIAINDAGGNFVAYSGQPTVVKPPPALAGYIGADFLSETAQTAIPPVSGDFNGDGLADIALIGGSYGVGQPWHLIPVAFSSNDGNGGFWCTDNQDDGFNDYFTSNVGTPQLVAADFNGDGLSDLALVGLTSAQNVGKAFIAVAYAIQDTATNRFQGFGSFTRIEVPLVAPSGHAAADFNTWASLPGVKAVAGDFDGDGYGDIALAGPTGLSSVPVAFLRKPGAGANFTYVLSTAFSTSTFAAQAATANAQLVAGDFDGDGVTDLALSGPASWNYVGLGMSPTFSTNIGAFLWTQDSAGLSTWAQIAGLPNVNAISTDHGGPYLSKSDIKINAGGPALAPFVADTDFSGGAAKTRTNTINLSGVVNPAPMAVYQSQHYASPFTYTIPGFSAGSSHLIRLHFAETNPLNNAPNKRKFSVAINGTTQISNLDLYATVGLNKAYIKEFRLPANSSGKYVLSFTATIDSATISGIEVL